MCLLVAGLHRLLDYVQSFGPERVWLCRRVDIATHWLHKHPPNGDPPYLHAHTQEAFTTECGRHNQRSDRAAAAGASTGQHR
eukprot:6198370-Pleurochrysis_carterae.AAC.1